MELLGLKMIKPAYWTNVLSNFDMVLYQLIHNIISPANPDPNKYIVHHYIWQFEQDHQACSGHDLLAEYRSYKSQSLETNILLLPIPKRCHFLKLSTFGVSYYHRQHEIGICQIASGYKMYF